MGSLLVRTFTSPYLGHKPKARVVIIIQVKGHTPRVVLFDTGAQLVILGVQFTKKMGMLDSKLRKSMW